MNTALAIAVGILVYVVLMALLLAVIRMKRTPNDQELEDMEQIVAVSKPAPLERPHVKAGTAWGSPLQ